VEEAPTWLILGDVSWGQAFEADGKVVLSRWELLSLGATGASLTAAVRGGHLVRARRDHYLLPSTNHHIVEAVRIGGRLTCVSALAFAGIYSFDSSRTHVQMERTMSRSRSPRDRFIPLTPYNRAGVQLHWTASTRSSEFSVSISEALSQSLRCQRPVHALASIDNALFLGRVTEGDLTEIFSGAPARVQYLRALIDGRAESGQETVLRRIILDAGLACEPQVWIDGVGRVDFVVEGCLVVEADSRLAHEGWENHVRDRSRDLLLAKAGYMSLRPAYQHTMENPDLVRSAIFNLLSARMTRVTHANSIRTLLPLPDHTDPDSHQEKLHELRK